MRKIVYLCVIMMLCLNVMAQIDTYDQNWRTVVSDDFDEPNRQFNNSFQEPLGKWIAYAHSLWPSGVTKIPLMHIYQGISDVSTFSTGLYYNEIGSYFDHTTSQARKYPLVPIETTLNDWHIFACEWLPEHVIWYCDGNIDRWRDDRNYENLS